jgi:hypothetical protein
MKKVFNVLTQGGHRSQPHQDGLLRPELHQESGLAEVHEPGTSTIKLFSLPLTLKLIKLDRLLLTCFFRLV